MNAAASESVWQKRKRLQDNFVEAAHQLNILLAQQMQAVIDGDPDFDRFEVLLHAAQEQKEMAKYAWIGHMDSHHSEES